MFDRIRRTRELFSGTSPKEVELGTWPEGVSDGLSLPCADCGEVPRFDYGVTDDFWRRHVPGPERLGVVCLPCLDRRCDGVGLAAALQEIQWTGTYHTVVLRPSGRFVYGRPF